jgi:hypothetical protein
VHLDVDKKKCLLVWIWWQLTSKQASCKMERKKCIAKRCRWCEGNGDAICSLDPLAQGGVIDLIAIGRILWKRVWHVPMAAVVNLSIGRGSIAPHDILSIFYSLSEHLVHMSISAPSFWNIKKIMYLCFKKSSHLFHEYTYMFRILVRCFARSCIVFWATGKKQICGYV